ncbi:MAG: cell division protein ZapE [Alphaproteobacteria bacterium]
MSQKSPLQIYQQRLNDGELKPDPVQEIAVSALDRLFHEVIAYKPKKGWFGKSDPLPRGVYMYGGVGRGKSMLMDLFHDCLPKAITSRRVHFHEFMIEVHDYIHSRREAEGASQGIDGALPLFAQRIAERSRVLCFDEFHVVDVADAMILGRLFRCLYELGVVVVSTSNWEPDRLYEGGLQRDRFLPFIELLKERQEVIHLDSPHDYRTQFLAEGGNYFTPLGVDTAARLDEMFAVLTHGGEVHADEISVKGRVIQVRVAAKDVARFSFAELCEAALGAEDYLAVAARYHTIFLEDIPHLKTKRNEAKRLMNLIDVLYENEVNVVISAAAAPDGLYAGSDHAYEFERTISRLMEMQSVDYIEGQNK